VTATPNDPAATPPTTAIVRGLGLRIGQADRRRAQLVTEVNSWSVDTATYLAPDGLSQCSRYYPVDPQATDAWPLLVSECLHHLRSALDNIAFALAKQHTPNLTKAQRRDAAFPITNTGKKWTEAASMIKAMSPAACTAIRTTQPLHDADPTQHPLSLLQRLQNQDKHRALHTVITGIPSAELILPNDIVESSEHHLRQVPPGEDFATLHFRRAQTEVYAHFTVGIEHRIDLGDTSYEVVALLTTLQESVQDAVAQLLPHLDQSTRLASTPDSAVQF